MTSVRILCGTWLLVSGVMAEVQPQPLPAPVAARHVQAEPAHELSPVAHLRVAAEHLRAAGEEQLADELEQKVTEHQAHLKAQVTAMSAQLAKMRKELDELEAMAGGPQIKFECQLVELSNDILEELLPSHQSLQITPHSKAVQTFKRLRQEREARVLSAPTVLTLLGQSAQIVTGQEIPISVGDSPHRIDFLSVGMQMQLLPEQLQEDGTLELNATVQHSWIADDEQQVRTVAGEEVPSITTAKKALRVTLGPDETLWIRTAGKNKNQGLLWLITPEQVQP